MIVGGVGSDIPFLPAEATAVSAEAAVPAEAAAVPAEAPVAAQAKPLLRTALARDAFRPAPLDPNAGLAAANPEVPAAVSELRSARQDLRAARRDVNQGTATVRERVALREARQDVRTARQNLRETISGGEALPIKPDVFAPVDQSPVELFPDPAELLPEAPGLLPETPEILPESPIDMAPPQDNGLALGRMLPAISQVKPNGFANGYHNGDMNCAPASMAMIARGIPGGVLDGKPVDQMSDAELINRLGRHGQTDRQGTSPNGVVAMAEELGLSTSARQGGLNTDYYDAVLAGGGSIVANGAYHDDTGEAIGHFVTVTGKTFDGNYVVNDPRLGETIVVTPAQLDAFLRNNPINGGVSIGVR